MWEAETEGGSTAINKPLGGEKGLIKATGGDLAHTIVRKATGVAYSGWLGDVEGMSGEPTLGGTPGDPTSGWGVNGIVAGVSNTIEGAMLLLGYEPKGYVGAVVDGMVEGLSDASLFIFTFKFMNAYAIGKKSGTGGGGATAGFNYEKRRAELDAQRRAQQPVEKQAANVRVEQAQRAVRADPWAGYR